MDPTLKAALQGAAPTVFTAVKIELSGGDVRLVDGGFVSIDGAEYLDEHSIYGALGKVETIEDGADGQATRCTLTLLPPSDAALAALASAQEQDAPVTVWKGAVNRATGAVSGLEVLFQGEFDYPHLSVTSNSWVLTVECGTEEGRLLEPNEERRLSDSFHKAVWPGERGLENVTNVEKKVFWRANDPASDAVSKRVPSAAAQVVQRVLG